MTYVFDLTIIPGKVKANRVKGAVYQHSAAAIAMPEDDLCGKELNLNLLLCIIASSIIIQQRKRI
jgi:hypothetical protein